MSSSVPIEVFFQELTPLPIDPLTEGQCVLLDNNQIQAGIMLRTTSLYASSA